METAKFTVYELFSGNKSKYLIPDYQRPYAWGSEQCIDLWNDLKGFALDEEDFDCNNFEYFLGNMVTFKNENLQDEVIDGQQRLTTLLLFMRAYYDALDIENPPPIRNDLGKCIWVADERGVLDTSFLKITSEVLQENANEEFSEILKNGTVDKNSKSNYAENYRYFQEKIGELKERNFHAFEIFPARILHNCFVTKIRATTQETALRMFSTLNDRGCPLSDTDIFKAVLYKNALKTGGLQAKNDFVERWERLESRCNDIFKMSSRKITPFEFAFLTYSYKMAKVLGARRSLREFFGENNYALLKDTQTLKEIEALLNFFTDLRSGSLLRFSHETLRKTYILLRTNTVTCMHALSNFFLLKHGDDFYTLNEEEFNLFCDQATAFLIGAACSGAVGSATSGIGFLPLQLLIKKPTDVSSSHLFSKEIISNNIRNFSSMRGKKFALNIVLNWWTFKNENQELLPLEKKLNIEHIFAKKRADFNAMKDPDNLNLLGNLALLEQSVNSRASDYRFSDKCKIYLGYANSKGVFVGGTQNRELQMLAHEKKDFSEVDIVERNERILADILAILDHHHFLTK